jgi:hypothetical protein
MSIFPKPGDLVLLSEIHPGEVDYGDRDRYENQMYYVRKLMYTESGMWIGLETMFGERLYRHFKYSLITLVSLVS